jgi:hypothetical protein
LNNNPRINHFMPSIIICRQILIHCHKLHHPITISQESSHNGLDLSLDTFSKSCKAQTGISQRTLIDSAMFPWPQLGSVQICWFAVGNDERDVVQLLELPWQKMEHLKNYVFKYFQIGQQNKCSPEDQ